MATRIKRDIFTGELVEEQYDPSPAGRSVICRGSLPYGDQTVLGRRVKPSISDCDPHVGRSLGVHPKQAARFNATLEEYGVTDARYSNKTGDLTCVSREGKAAAWALRGHFDPDAGSIEQKYASAIGF